MLERKVITSQNQEIQNYQIMELTEKVRYVILAFSHFLIFPFNPLEFPRKRFPLNE